MSKLCDNNNQILAEVIDTLRECGAEIKSPYDFENWMADNACHSQLLETGRFEHDES